MKKNDFNRVEGRVEKWNPMASALNQIYEGDMPLDDPEAGLDEPNINLPDHTKKKVKNTK